MKQDKIERIKGKLEVSEEDARFLIEEVEAGREIELRINEHNNVEGIYSMTTEEVIEYREKGGTWRYNDAELIKEIMEEEDNK